MYKKHAHIVFLPYRKTFLQLKHKNIQKIIEKSLDKNVFLRYILVRLNKK